MIIDQLDRHLFGWITEVETFLILNRGINPYVIEESMTVWDFQQFVKSVLDKIKQEADEVKSGKNTLIDQLVNLREYLNIMKLPGKKTAVT